MNAAGVGWVAYRAGDVSAMRYGTNSCSQSRCRPTRGTAWSNRSIPRIARMTMQTIAGEMAQRKRGCIRAANDNGPGLAQIGNDRVVDLCLEVTLDAQSVRRCMTGLINIDLDRNRHPGKWADLLAPRQALIDLLRRLQGLVGKFRDHGVDRRIDPSGPCERVRCDFFRRKLP